MTYSLRLFAAFAVFLFLTPIGARAQRESQIAGVVRDTNGNVLPGVSVEVSGPALAGTIRSATTDANGQYRFVRLPMVDQYTVSYSLAGFWTERREGLELLFGFTLPMNVKMHAEDEMKSVAGQADSATLSGTVVDQFNFGMAGVSLTMTGPERRTTTSERLGQFSFADLPAGDYELRASREGDTTAVRRMRVRLGTNVTGRIELHPRPEVQR